MTAPIWMAVPPEVHSALLSSGPGPTSLLAAADAWDSLSAEYLSAADDLTAVLTSVQPAVWEGPSAESYAAAHAPYLAWLMQASADSAAAATQHETAAAAYTAALAAMPTLPELATNHMVHGVLLATNFFGINTIPIALNEADYVRMWVQAATTMTTYQAVSAAAVASSPQTTSTPHILKTAGSTSAQATGQAQASSSGASTGLGDQLAALLQKLGVTPQIVNDYGIDNIYDFLNDPVSYTETHLISRLLTDPLALLENPLLVFFDGDEVFFPLGYAILPASAVGLATASVGSVGAVAGLAGTVAAEPAAIAVAPVPTPAPASPAMLPAIGTAPTVAAAGAPATAPVLAPAPATATATVGPVPTPPPAAGGVAVGYPYLVGPPGIGFGSTMSARARSVAKQKAPESDSAVAAAAAAVRDQRQARRRRRAISRDHGDEFADMNIEVNPDWDATPGDESLASGNGAGPLGFAGTVRNESVERAAGLATLTGDEFGGGPTVPMVPGGWESGARQQRPTV
jgi:PPE-repeat protein